MYSKSRRFDKFTPISNLIERIGKKKLTNNFSNKFIEHQIKLKWEDIVGSQIAPYTTPGFLRGKNLYVCTLSPVMATELGFMKETFIDNINSFFQKKVVENIFFTIGEVYKPLNKLAENKSLDDVEITSDEIEKINEAMKPLKGDLKDLLTRIMTKSIKRDKFKNEFVNKE